MAPDPLLCSHRPAGRPSLHLVAATLLMGLAGPLLCRPALASSPAAWASYDRQVRSSCLAASALVGVRVRGARLDLPNLGLSTLLLEGRYRQPALAGQRGFELCVFEQRNGRATVAEADRFLAPAPPEVSPAPLRPVPPSGLP
jgi:hypothetical protein